MGRMGLRGFLGGCIRARGVWSLLAWRTEDGKEKEKERKAAIGSFG